MDWFFTAVLVLATLAVAAGCALVTYRLAARER
jgi:hypothetical protein